MCITRPDLITIRQYYLSNPSHPWRPDQPNPTAPDQPNPTAPDQSNQTAPVGDNDEVVYFNGRGVGFDIVQLYIYIQNRYIYVIVHTYRYILNIHICTHIFIF